MTAEKATAQEATRKVAFAKVLAIQIIAYVVLVALALVPGMMYGDAAKPARFRSRSSPRWRWSCCVVVVHVRSATASPAM